MALPPPYWLQPNPNRGTAPTLDSLPPKLDLLTHSGEDIDYTLELLLSTGPDVYENTDNCTAEMAIWRDDGAGGLALVDTLTQASGRIILGAGTIRFIITSAEHEAYDASEVFYNIAITDAIPRTRQKLGGMIVFADRLRTLAS